MVIIFKFWFTVTEKPEDQQAAWCHPMIGNATTSTLRLVLDDNSKDDVAARLHAEFGRGTVGWGHDMIGLCGTGHR